MTSETRVGRGWLAALALLVVGFAGIAADTAFHFFENTGGTPIDGPFQLYNGLRRIADGQRLGDTFQVFHGPGVPYLHFIPFVLFGGDLFASELARALVSISAALAVLIAFFRAWTGTWRAAVPMSVAALALLIPLRVNALLFPINSMIGLRSTMPLVIGIHLLMRPHGRRAMLERALLFAITLACGIEQGMAAMAGYGFLQILIAIRTRAWRAPLLGIATIVLGVLAYAALILILSPSGFASVMRFNFSEVPGDQMWYFGAPPNQFFFRWIHLFILFEHPIWTALILFALCYAIARYWMSPSGDDADTRVAEAFLMLYAVVSPASMLGTFSTVYLQPAVRVSLFLILVAVRRWWLWRRDDLRLSPDLRRRIPAYAVVAVAGYAAAGWTLASIAVVRTPLHMVYAHLYHGVPMEMSPRWQATEQVADSVMARTTALLGRKPVLWSTYASLVEDKHDLFHPSFDFIIHALGPENRAEYAETFERTKPDLVQTLAPTYTGYEEWLSAHHWNFYRPLFRDYQISAVGPWSYFWTRAPQPFNEQPVTISKTPIPPGTLALRIPTGTTDNALGFFEVRLWYHVNNPWKSIPVVGTLPRYVVHVGGATNHIPVSLAPYATEKRFPVLAVGATSFTLVGEVISIVDGARLVFDSIRVDRLQLSPANYRWARDFIAGPPRFNPDTTSFGPADTVSATRRR